jgi:large subunit ribosomal protein L13
LGRIPQLPYFCAPNFRVNQGFPGRRDRQSGGWPCCLSLINRTSEQLAALAKKSIMSKLHFTTKHANAATVQRNWFVVDGTNQTVGRMCARIAAILRGKNKAYYTPHVDCGDYIVVINADKVKFTGNKLDEKLYDHYTGYPGGRKEELAKDLLKRRPEVIVERGVKGMLPKNRLGRQMYKKLFVYAGDKHPHTAQQPKDLKF